VGSRPARLYLGNVLGLFEIYVIYVVVMCGWVRKINDYTFCKLISTYLCMYACTYIPVTCMVMMIVSVLT
jgi:hypothetical protein